jgi:hypothetical protein
MALSTRLGAFAAGLLLAMAAFAPLTLTAQDATPGATPAAAPEIGDEIVFDRLYPVTINTGTCTETIGETVHDLEFAIPVGSDDAGELGTVQGANVMAAEATLSTSLGDLFESTHAIVVHDPDDMNIVIACGDFGGYAGSGKAAVALAAVNDNDIVGAAILDPDENRLLGLLDDQVHVTVYLVKINSVSRNAEIA